MTTTESYQAVSAKLFDQAQVELDAGDLVQASEKFWGATAQALKAIAEDRGWRHDSHARLYVIVRNIVDETGDREIVDLFDAAQLLHVNFYEHWLEADEIDSRAIQVRELLTRLATIELN